MDAMLPKLYSISICGLVRKEIEQISFHIYATARSIDCLRMLIAVDPRRIVVPLELDVPIDQIAAVCA